MKKDDRLYARFDIGMDEHPKIMLLSDAAFRTLIEATLYARRQLTDGFLDERVAVRKWGREALDELAANHGERPSLELVDGGWQIRDYAEHQITRADIERKREAGRLGGLAKAKQTSSKNVAGARKPQPETASKPLAEGLANGYETLAKTETETERETSTSTEVDVITPDAIFLCDLLADLIEGNGSKRPTITKAWHDAARLLITKDNRQMDKAADLIRWSQQDTFWRSNILSMPKFREKYDQLRLQAEKQNAPVRSNREMPADRMRQTLALVPVEPQWKELA